MKGMSSTMKSVLTRLAIGATIVIGSYSTGCNRSGTEPEDAAGVVMSEAVPSLAEIQAMTGASREQTAALAPALETWRRAEIAWSTRGPQSSEPPMLDFVVASTTVLDATQERQLLVGLLHASADRATEQSLDDRLFGIPPGQIAGGRGPGGPGRGRGPGHGRHGGEPFDQLGLTAAQLEQVRQARQDLKASIADLVAQLRAGSLTPEQFEAGVETARASHEAALQGILTAEQYAQLQQLRRDRLVAQLTVHLARFDADIIRRVTALDALLELSDAQVIDIQVILAGSKTAVQAVLDGLEDGTLSPQEAQSALRQVERDTTSAVRATLTPEQAAIFDALIKLRRLFPGCRP